MHVNDFFAAVTAECQASKVPANLKCTERLWLHFTERNDSKKDKANVRFANTEEPNWGFHLVQREGGRIDGWIGVVEWGIPMKSVGLQYMSQDQMISAKLAMYYKETIKTAIMAARNRGQEVPTVVR